MASIIGAMDNISWGNTLTLVYWVKKMQEMRCVFFAGVKDVEVVGHWLYKIEESIF
jgi:hypothetical protein